MANENESEDTVSLQDLVQNEGGGNGPSIAGAPVPNTAAQEAVSESATKPAAGPTPELDLGQIDNLLAAEDPEFAASLEELKSQEIEGDKDVEIDSLDLEKITHDPSVPAVPSEKPKGWKRLVYFVTTLVDDGIHFARHFRKNSVSVLKNGAAAALHLVKDGVKAVLGFIQHTIKAFIALKWTSKLLVLVVVALAGAFVFVTRLAFQGKELPNLQAEFLNGFEGAADHVYEYDPSSPMENFQNPLLHPESVVLIDKLVVNLKPPGDGSNPMGMFEFYVETASRESAIELNDRKVEAKDVVLRTLEQMPYDELVTEAGKHKLKMILRKNLNEFLTKGRVRKIFFKTIVLKP